MANKKLLSVPDKLLLAAYHLEETGRRPFSAEDLVVAAWRQFPDAFSLAGYRGSDDGQLLYPDSNRVFAEIMGTKPIRKRGLLIKVGNKMYQLTEAGRERARSLLIRSGGSPAEKSGLARELRQELNRLFSSKANEKYRNGRLNDLTFHDACAFWGISPRSSAIEFNGRIANFNGVIDAARKVIQGKVVSFEHGSQTYSDKDLDMLLEVHNYMLKRFSSDIEFIQRRTDERR